MSARVINLAYPEGQSTQWTNEYLAQTIWIIPHRNPKSSFYWYMLGECRCPGSGVRGVRGPGTSRRDSSLRLQRAQVQGV